MDNSELENRLVELEKRVAELEKIATPNSDDLVKSITEKLTKIKR